MAEITLLRGQTALIDDEDLPKVAGYRWHLAKGYARTSIKIADQWTTVWLHRFIMKAKPGTEIDHKDGTNKLDCRKQNLRLATRKIQVANQLIRKNKASRFKGVYLKRKRRWGAQLQTTVGGVKHKLHLGYFDTEMDAAHAYNTAAQWYFGEFALLNPI